MVKVCWLWRECLLFEWSEYGGGEEERDRAVFLFELFWGEGKEQGTGVMGDTEGEKGKSQFNSFPTRQSGSVKGRESERKRGAAGVNTTRQDTAQ